MDPSLLPPHPQPDNPPPHQRYLTEDRLRSIANSLPDVVFVFSRDGHCLDALETQPHLIAYPTSGALIGSSIHETYPPAMAQAVMATINETLVTGTPQSLVYELSVKEGKRWFEASTAPLIAPPSNPEAVVWIARDITERRRSEIERERLMAELDKFGHTVAHDLKNPLQLLMGYISLMLDDSMAMSPDELHGALNQMQIASYRMLNIIEGLMLLSGVRQMANIPSERLDMAKAAKSAADMVRPLIDQHDARIEIPDSLPTALGYAPWVDEVWTNYISNAIKYGGRPPSVIVGADAPDSGMIRFWVRDNGSGLEPDALNRLFTPFTRDKDAELMALGHGLGLSIVQRIVERLGGTVGAESVVGEGSIFWFTLPTAAD